VGVGNCFFFVQLFNRIPSIINVGTLGTQRHGGNEKREACSFRYESQNFKIKARMSSLDVLQIVENYDITHNLDIFESLL